MKKILFFLLTCFMLLNVNQAFSQCTPVNCAADLPPYGGLCDTVILTGLVNTPYSDFESFVITDNCFSAQIIDPSQPAIDIKITNIDNFTFSNLPNGITAATNASSYSPPSGGTVAGCASYSGTPTEAGIFPTQIDFLADVTLCGAFPFPQPDNPANYVIQLTILPDAGFSGLSSSYCTSDAPATLAVTGTAGGVFSGPGVTGTTFDPAAAGIGTHTIMYTVSAMEGAAIAPATNSSTMTVTVDAAMTYYADTDMDGYGDNANSITACGAPNGYVTDNTDCDDTNSGINPGATDILDNGIDEDCVGGDATSVPVDNDMDGSFNDVDCDDTNNTIYPGAPELCDGLDNDCDGDIDEGIMSTYYADADMDGYGDAAVSVMDCAAPTGYVTDNTDCDDTNAALNPGATEVCDGIDNNCDGNIDEGLTINTYYADADMDGYGDANAFVLDCATTPPTGYVTDNTDCDDTNAALNPGATEVCDGIDNNCDGNIDEGLTINTYYADADMDGYGDAAVSVMDCAAPTGYVTDNTDCDDTNAALNPGATEICDGIDNNCDGDIDEGLTLNTYYADMDADGYGDPNASIMDCATTAPTGYVTDNTDCDDGNAGINPGATDIPDNGTDEDCDGMDTTATNDIFEAFGLKASPNPAHSYLNLEGNLDQVVDIQVYDILGKEMISVSGTINPSFTLDISSLGQGTYILKIIDAEQKTGVSKFLVSKH